MPRFTHTTSLNCPGANGTSVPDPAVPLKASFTQAPRELSSSANPAALSGWHKVTRFSADGRNTHNHSDKSFLGGHYYPQGVRVPYRTPAVGSYYVAASTVVLPTRPDDEAAARPKHSWETDVLGGGPDAPAPNRPTVRNTYNRDNPMAMVSSSHRFPRR